MNSLTLKCGLLIAFVSIGLWPMPQAKAQEILNSADSARVGRLLDSDNSSTLLDCSIHPQKPTLGFGLRFHVEYIVICSMSQFAGRAITVFIGARVTPDGGKPVLLGESFEWPEDPDSTEHDLKNADAEMSGGFAAGEGQYQVEVLVDDKGTGQTARKSWLTNVPGLSGKLATAVAIPPRTVVPMVAHTSPIKLDTSGKGLRVSILLNAAPLDPRSATLRAEDRAFLLGSLSSMVRKVPCASVRLRVYNLDQRQELFHQDQFDEAGFTKLREALGAPSLGTISVRTLQQPGGLDMLRAAADNELTTRDPSDAIIILGPRTVYRGRLPRWIQTIKEPGTPNPHIYDFEYVQPYLRPPPIHSHGGLQDVLALERTMSGMTCLPPVPDPSGHGDWLGGGCARDPKQLPPRGDRIPAPWPPGLPVPKGCQFPDTICVLTRMLGGTVYPYFSPGDFARSIQKMRASLQPFGGSPKVKGAP